MSSSRGGDTFFRTVDRKKSKNPKRKRLPNEREKQDRDKSLIQLEDFKKLQSNIIFSKLIGKKGYHIVYPVETLDELYVFTLDTILWASKLDTDVVLTEFFLLKPLPFLKVQFLRGHGKKILVTGVENQNVLLLIDLESGQHTPIVRGNTAAIISADFSNSTVATATFGTISIFNLQDKSSNVFNTAVSPTVLTFVSGHHIVIGFMEGSLILINLKNMHLEQTQELLMTLTGSRTVEELVIEIIKLDANVIAVCQRSCITVYQISGEQIIGNTESKWKGIGSNFVYDSVNQEIKWKVAHDEIELIWIWIPKLKHLENSSTDEDAKWWEKFLIPERFSGSLIKEVKGNIEFGVKLPTLPGSQKLGTIYISNSYICGASETKCVIGIQNLRSVSVKDSKNSVSLKLEKGDFSIDLPYLVQQGVASLVFSNKTDCKEVGSIISELLANRQSNLMFIANSKMQKHINEFPVDNIPVIHLTPSLSSPSLRVEGPNINNNLPYIIDKDLCAISVSNYPRVTNPDGTIKIGSGHTGDPICDQFCVEKYQNRIIFALADGCNWGAKVRQAAKLASKTFIEYCKQQVFSSKETPMMAKHFLQALVYSHFRILEGHENSIWECGTTTIMGGSILEINSPNYKWGVLLLSLGDCQSYHLSIKNGKVNLSPIQDSGRMWSLTNASDCGGRIGPFLESEPDLRNLSVIFKFIEEGDFVITFTDGVYDNLDPQTLGFDLSDANIPELQGKTWDNVGEIQDKEILLKIAKYKENYSTTILRNLIEAMLNTSQEISSVTIAQKIIEYTEKATRKAREDMEKNPNVPQSKDYKLFPGKLDHTTCIVSRAGYSNFTEYQDKLKTIKSRLELSMEDELQGTLFKGSDLVRWITKDPAYSPTEVDFAQSLLNFNLVSPIASNGSFKYQTFEPDFLYTFKSEKEQRNTGRVMSKILVKKDSKFVVRTKSERDKTRTFDTATSSEDREKGSPSLKKKSALQRKITPYDAIVNWQDYTAPESLNDEDGLFHFRRLRITPEKAATLSFRLDIDFKVLKHNRIEMVFQDELLYYHFEMFLKSRLCAELLYFLSDVEDFRSCKYESVSVMKKCSENIIEMWFHPDSPICSSQMVKDKLLSDSLNIGKFDFFRDDPDKQILTVVESLYYEFLEIYSKGFFEVAKKMTFIWKKAKKRRVGEKKFHSMYEDKTLYRCFEEYLGLRNTAPYLQFIKQYRDFLQQPSKQKSEVISISDMYFSKKKITVNSKLLDNLKDSLDSGDMESILLSLKVIADNIIIELKDYWVDFCWDVYNESSILSKFHQLLDNEGEAKSFINEFKDNYELNTLMKFCLAVKRIKQSDGQVSLIEDDETTSESIDFQSVGVKPMAPEMEKSHEIGRMLTSATFQIPSMIPHIKRVKVMLRCGIYSISMFDEIFKIAKKHLLLLFIDMSMSHSQKSLLLDWNEYQSYSFLEGTRSYHFKQLRVPPEKAHHLPPINPELRNKGLSLVLHNSLVYYHFEIYLKSKNISPNLYFLADVEDFRQSRYKFPHILCNCAQLIISHWYGTNSPITECAKTKAISRVQGILLGKNVDISDSSEGSNAEEKGQRKISTTINNGMFDREFRKVFDYLTPIYESFWDEYIINLDNQIGQRKFKVLEKGKKFKVGIKDFGNVSISWSNGQPEGRLWQNKKILSLFKEYLSWRSAVQWLNFLDEYGSIISKGVKSTKELWTVASIYFYGQEDRRKKVVISEQSLLENLKRALDSERLDDALICYNVIAKSVLEELREFYWDFCWAVHSQTQVNTKLGDIFETLVEHPVLLKGLNLCNKISVYKGMSLQNPDLFKKAKKIGKILFLESEFNKEANLEFHFNHIRNMLTEDIYSTSMFDEIYTITKKSILLHYVCIIEEKQSQLVKTFNRPKNSSKASQKQNAERKNLPWTQYTKLYDDKLPIYHIRQLRVSNDLAWTLPPLDITQYSQTKKTPKLSVVLRDELLYLHFEKYLKHHLAAENLYFVAEIEDFCNCLYKTPTVMNDCAKYIIDRWYIPGSPVITEDTNNIIERVKIQLQKEVRIDIFDMEKFKVYDILEEFLMKFWNAQVPLSEQMDNFASNWGKKLKKKTWNEDKVGLVMKDKGMYNAFEEYLAMRNASQWLYFTEQFYQQQSFNLSAKEAREIASLFFFGKDEGKKMIYLGDPTPLINLRNILETDKDHEIPENLLKIYLDVKDHLKEFWWDFCVTSILHSSDSVQFHTLLENKEQWRTFRETFTNLASLVNGISLCRKMKSFSEMCVTSEDLPNVAQSIYEFFLKNPESSLEKKVSRHVTRLETMMKSNIYSPYMFDQIFDIYKKYFILKFVQANLDITKQFKKEFNRVRLLSIAGPSDWSSYTQPQTASLETATPTFHLRQLRLSTEKAWILPPLALFLEPEKPKIDIVFSDERFYYQFEKYLKSHMSSENLYYLIEVEDFSTCRYVSKNVLKACASGIISRWYGGDSIICNERDRISKLQTMEPDTGMFFVEQLNTFHVLEDAFALFLNIYAKKELEALKENGLLKKMKKKISISNFHEVMSDKGVYQNFDKYLKLRNASQWLYFVENFPKLINSSNFIVDVVNFSYLYFLGKEDKQQKIYLSNPQLLDELKKAIEQSHQEKISRAISAINAHVTSTLKEFWWDFCLLIAAQNSEVTKFYELFKNIENWQNAKPAISDQYSEWKANVDILFDIQKFRNLSVNDENLIGEAQIIAQKISKKLYDSTFTPANLFDYTGRIQTMISKGIYSPKMFDTYCRVLRNHLMMQFVENDIQVQSKASTSLISHFALPSAPLKAAQFSTTTTNNNPQSGTTDWETETSNTTTNSSIPSNYHLTFRRLGSIESSWVLPPIDPLFMKTAKLSSILHDDFHFYHFEIFLKGLLSAENLHFLSDVEEFRNCIYTSKEVLKNCSLILLEKWFQNSSFLSIDYAEKKSLMKDCNESPTIRLFDLWWNQAYDVVEEMFQKFQSSYPKIPEKPYKEWTTAAKKATKKKPVTEGMFASLLSEKSIYCALECYLKLRNSVQWLYFYEDYERFSKNASFKTLKNAVQIAQTYVFASGEEKIRKIHSVPKALYEKLLASTEEGKLDTIAQRLKDVYVSFVEPTLKELWWDFCYEVNATTPFFDKFQELFTNETSRTNFANSFSDAPDILRGVKFILKVNSYQQMKLNNDLPKEAQKIWQLFRTDLMPFLTVPSAKVHLDRIRTMLIKEIYSPSMFDEITKLFKKQLFLNYTILHSNEKVSLATIATPSREGWSMGVRRESTSETPQERTTREKSKSTALKKRGLNTSSPDDSSKKFNVI